MSLPRPMHQWSHLRPQEVLVRDSGLYAHLSTSTLLALSRPIKWIYNQHTLIPRIVMKFGQLLYLATAVSCVLAATNLVANSGAAITHSELAEVPVSSDEELHSDYAQSLYMSISMIVVSEIGDKTFLIAALMAMKHLRLLVFSAAFASLAVMTVLLGIVGHALPSMVSQRVTQLLALVLFVVFGAKLLMEGLAMSKEAGVDEEMAEVEEELQASELNARNHGLESNSAKSEPWYQEIAGQLTDLASFVLSPTWIQVFAMTFLGEWGDRSQIATIAMAAGSDYWFVIAGAIVGHGMCTAAACIGGQLLATRISMRTVTLGGAVAFFVFSVLYFYDFYYYDASADL